jgi:hypothetical protein
MTDRLAAPPRQSLATASYALLADVRYEQSFANAAAFEDDPAPAAAWSLAVFVLVAGILAFALFLLAHS